MPLEHRIRRSATNVVVYVLMIVFILALFFPIYWVFTISTKVTVDMFTVPPTFIYRPIVQHYEELFLGGGLKRIAAGTFLSALINSVKISSSAVIFTALLGIPAAYAIARIPFKGKKGLSMWLLTALMLPPVVTIIPLRWMYQQVGRSLFTLYDTWYGIAIANMMFLVPFFIWLLRGFFLEIPKDLEEAGYIDGCSHMQTFIRVLLPLAVPGISMTATLCLILSWNTFLFPFMLAGKNAMTAPVALTGFISFEEISWGKLAAGGLVMMIPPVILAFFFQKAIVRGLTFGAVKG